MYPMAVGYAPHAVGVQAGPSIVGNAGGLQLVGAAPYHPAYGSPYGQRPAFGHPAYGLRAPMPHPGMAPMVHPYSGVPHIVNHPPTQVREFIIGFGPAAVNALSTAIFQAQPQLIFRGSRLIVPSSLANNFVINDIRVGKDSQAVSANPIPAATFSELAVGVALGLDTATPGILITLSTSNTTNAQQTFSASLIGTSMQ